MLKSSQEAWFASALGQHLLSIEQEKYNAEIGDIFGFYAVQLGMPNVKTLQHSRIPNVFYADLNEGDINCDNHHLPFAENAIDMLCMPHTLELSDNPYQALREAARALLPEGYLILTGFNPFSLWGLRRVFYNKLQYPWRSNFVSTWRIKSWLALLSLEFIDMQFCVYEPPISTGKWRSYFSFMNKMGEKWWPRAGGLYFIVAKKRVTNMTLLKPNWKKRRLKTKLLVVNHKKVGL